MIVSTQEVFGDEVRLKKDVYAVVGWLKQGGSIHAVMISKDMKFFTQKASKLTIEHSGEMAELEGYIRARDAGLLIGVPDAKSSNN